MGFLELNLSMADLPLHATMSVNLSFCHPFDMYFSIKNMLYNLESGQFTSEGALICGVTGLHTSTNALSLLLMPSIAHAAMPTPFIKDPLLTATLDLFSLLLLTFHCLVLPI